MKLKKGMILAAGLGKRMKPVTLNIPKPLIKIGNKNLLERALELLINHGVEEVAINVHHLADQIENFINENEEVILLVHNSESQSSSNAIIERSRFTTLSGSTQRKCLQDFYIFEPAAVGYETEDPNSQYGYAELFVHRELFAIRNQRFVQDSSQNWRIQPGTSYELDVRLKKALPGSTCDD